MIQAVEDMGRLDNTLVIYIEGDNGTSAEGTALALAGGVTTSLALAAHGKSLSYALLEMEI